MELIHIGVEPDARGLANDRTSYLRSQQLWRCDKSGRRHSSQDVDLYRFQRGDRPSRTDLFGPFKWNGHVMWSLIGTMSQRTHL